MSLKAAIIGGGNVASHFLQALTIKVVSHVFVRKIDSQEHFPKELLREDRDLSNIYVDLVIIAVSDDQILNVLETYLFQANQLIVHTAGAVNISVVLKKYRRCGVIYPLMTLSKSVKVAYQRMPILVEGSDAEVEDLVFKFAKLISQEVSFMDSARRKVMHLAAVIASNFTTALMLDVEEILDRQAADKRLLAPLMNQTIAKIFDGKVKNALTGPAIRNDVKTMEMHMRLLDDFPDIQQRYVLFSNSIQKISSEI